jgi:hypothetical protein
MEAFHCLESWSQSRHNVEKALTYVEGRFVGSYEVNSKILFRSLKDYRTLSGPDGAWVDRLQGSAALSSFFTLKEALLKSFAFSSLKAVGTQPVDRQEYKKRVLVKSQSLLVAYSENFFLGLQMMDNLVKHKTASNLR